MRKLAKTSIEGNYESPTIKVIGTLSLDSVAVITSPGEYTPANPDDEFEF